MKHVLFTVFLGYLFAVALVCAILYRYEIRDFLNGHVLLVAISIVIIGLIVAIYCFRMYSHRFDTFCWAIWRRLVG